MASVTTSFRLNKGRSKFTPSPFTRRKVKNPFVAALADTKKAASSITQHVAASPPTLSGRTEAPAYRDPRPADETSPAGSPVSQSATEVEPLQPATSESATTEDEAVTQSLAVRPALLDLSKAIAPLLPSPRTSAEPTSAVPSGTRHAGMSIQVPAPGASGFSPLLSAAQVPRPAGDEDDDDVDDSTDTSQSPIRKRNLSRKKAPDEIEILTNYDEYDEMLSKDNSTTPIKDFCKLGYSHGKPSRAWYARKTERMKDAGNINPDAANAGAEEEVIGHVEPIWKARRRSSIALDLAAGKGNNGDEHIAKKQRVQINEAAPQLRIDKYGNVVVDTASLMVEHTALSGVEARPTAAMEIVDESNDRRLVNSSSYAKKATANDRWSTADTEMLYTGLSMLGTDLEMIATTFFAGRKTRSNVRNRFKREEAMNPDRIADILRNPVPFSMEALSKKTGQDYDKLTEHGRPSEQVRLSPKSQPSNAERETRTGKAADNRTESAGSGAKLPRTRRKGTSNATPALDDGLEVVGEVGSTLASDRQW